MWPSFCCVKASSRPNSMVASINCVPDHASFIVCTRRAQGALSVRIASVSQTLSKSVQFATGCKNTLFVLHNTDRHILIRLRYQFVDFCKMTRYLLRPSLRWRNIRRLPFAYQSMVEYLLLSTGLRSPPLSMRQGLC
jgi:hypothetical protein